MKRVFLTAVAAACCLAAGGFEKWFMHVPDKLGARAGSAGLKMMDSNAKTISLPLKDGTHVVIWNQTPYTDAEGLYESGIGVPKKVANGDVVTRLIAAAKKIPVVTLNMGGVTLYAYYTNWDKSYTGLFVSRGGSFIVSIYLPQGRVFDDEIRSILAKVEFRPPADFGVESAVKMYGRGSKLNDDLRFSMLKKITEKRPQCVELIEALEYVAEYTDHPDTVAWCEKRLKRLNPAVYAPVGPNSVPAYDSEDKTQSDAVEALISADVKFEKVTASIPPHGDVAVAKSKPKVEPKVVAPKVEPKVVAPKVEPKVVTPKVEPKVVTPKVEPKVVAPKVEPKVEAPKVEPKVEAPKVEPKVAPKVEPKVEAPKVEPKVEVPKAPKVEPKAPVKPGPGESEYKGRKWSYYIYNNGTVKINGISDYSGVIEFPDRLGGAEVTSIPYELCEKRKEMTGVVLPKGLKKIEKDAFAHCTGLKELVLPEGLETIGVNAFVECTELEKVVLPKSLKTLENGAFFLCDKLTGDFDLRGLEKVEGWLFKGCPRINSVILPDSLTFLDSYMFESCSNLTKVTIPQSVRFINSGVFGECVSFKGEMEIPEGVTNIEYGAFRDCSGLTSIKIPSSVRKFGDSVFQGCSGVSRFDVPKDLDKISEFMFAGCTGLTAFDIPNGVKKIGAGAFSSCSNITEIALPPKLEKIENWAFQEAVKLRSIDVPEGVGQIDPYAFAVCVSLKKVTLHEGLKKIREGAFRECTALEEITIPASVESIEVKAFEGCTNLKKVVFLGKKPKIVKGTFKGCTPDVEKLEPQPPKLPEGYGSVKMKTKTVTLPGGATMEMIYCPPGTYMMGTPEGMKKGASNDTQAPIKVTLTKGFWLGKYEVTQKQWLSVMGELSDSTVIKGDDFPAHGISWVKADEFCKKVGNGARLPTEGEWEYACRAGAPTAFPWGNTANGTRLACDGTDPFSYEEDKDKIPKGPTHEKPVKVGSYEPNAWGFHDMNGNVIEWCQDWFMTYWPRTTELTDPKGEEEKYEKNNKVMRGGSWGQGACGCTNSSRFYESKENRACPRGFRMAMDE